VGVYGKFYGFVQLAIKLVVSLPLRGNWFAKLAVER
jgi:hypothetical protein